MSDLFSRPESANSGPEETDDAFFRTPAAQAQADNERPTEQVRLRALGDRLYHMDPEAFLGSLVAALASAYPNVDGGSGPRDVITALMDPSMLSPEAAAGGDPVAVSDLTMHRIELGQRILLDPAARPGDIQHG